MARNKKGTLTHIDALHGMLQDPKTEFTLPAFAARRKINRAHAAAIFWQYRRSDRLPILIHEVIEDTKTGKRKHIYRAGSRLGDAKGYLADRVKLMLSHLRSVKHINRQIPQDFPDAQTAYTFDTNMKRIELMERDMEELLMRLSL